MTTSGTATFNRTRNEIISAAARKIGAIRAGETPGHQVVLDFAEALNALVKRWQASGLHLWTVEEATLFLQVAQTEYSIGSTSTDHCTQSYVATTLSGAEAAGQTTLSVTATTSITAADHIGIVLDDGTLQWSTVSSKTSSTVTIASALTSAAASGNAVYTYTTKIVRPLRIPAARRYIFSSGFEVDFSRPMSRSDYRAMPNKTAPGTVTQYYYDARGGANALGKFNVWPAPSDVANAVNFTWHRPIQDFNAAGDNPDLPQEWIDTLVFNLAVVMAPEYDCPPNRFAIIKGLADEYRDTLSGWDREIESARFQPDSR